MQVEGLICICSYVSRKHKIKILEYVFDRGVSGKIAFSGEVGWRSDCHAGNVPVGIDFFGCLYEYLKQRGSIKIIENIFETTNEL